MANFIKEFYYGNLDPQARSTKQNKTVQKQMEVLMLNEDFLTEHLSGENKKKFFEFCNAWGVVNGESNLDSFIMGFRLGANFTYDTFVSEDSPFTDLLKEAYSACPMTDGTIKNIDLMIDILASAYFMMFDRLSDEELRATRQNIGLAPNSICSILNYFIGTCNDPELRFDSPEALMKTLQMNIRKKLTEGDE